MKKSFEIPRRSLLKALGAFASLPIGQLMYRSIAHAQGMPAPLKFIGVYHPHGVSAEHYARRPTDTNTVFDLNFADSALTPFDSPTKYGGRSFKNRIITFEGVDLAVAELSGTSGHGAAVCLFTGSMTTAGDHNAQGPSLDQYLARTRGLGAGTPFPTLNLGVGASGDANQDAIAHAPGGAVIRNQLDPVIVFDQVFSSLVVNTDAAAAAAARRRGQSVLDFVRGDLNGLSGRLAAAEKLKLDQHLSALREIETRLTVVQQLTCTQPTRPQKTGNADPLNDFPRINKYNGGEPYFDRIADLQVDLLAQAIACGSTRFGTLFLDDPGKIYTVDGTALPRDVHNEVAHTYSTAATAAGLATRVRLARLNRYYYGKIARLMQRLDEGGALDSTVILAGSDMGNPSAHSTRNIPLLLAGGANGQLAMGRRLQSGPDLTSHNKVLVSVAKLFGDQSNTFGVANDPALITGGFPGL